MDLRLNIPSGKSWQTSGADGLPIARAVSGHLLSRDLKALLKEPFGTGGKIYAALIFFSLIAICLLAKSYLTI